MVPDCWFCGKPIHRNDAAETLHGTVAVHARCVERDVAGDDARTGDTRLKQAA